MPYTPTKPPQVSGSDAQALASYLNDELQVIASSLRVADSVSFSVSNKAPTRPRIGTLVYADGAHWDPGSGEGLYEYGSDGVWRFLQNTTPPSFPVFSTEVGKIEWWPTTVLQPGRLKANGQSVLRVTYPILSAYLIRSGTATFTNGSPNVGMSTHGLSFGDPIKLFTGGSLPTNFTAGAHGLPTVGVNYFVKTVVDVNTVTLSATVGGSAISAGSAGSGTHTWVNAPSGDGDGSTTVTLPDLRGNFTRGWNDDASVDSNRTIGGLQTDALQGHFHSASWASGFSGLGASAGSFTLAAGGNNATALNLTIGSPTTDGSNGTPRTAAETRPRNVSLMATIRYSA